VVPCAAVLGCGANAASIGDSVTDSGGDDSYDFESNGETPRPPGTFRDAVQAFVIGVVLAYAASALYGWIGRLYIRYF
jgi:hypothetical protein